MRGKLLIALASLCVGFLLAWWWLSIRPRKSDSPPPAAQPAQVPVTPSASPGSASITPGSSPLVENPVALEPSRPPMTPAEIARIVEDNSQPGRMVFVEFKFARGGIVATHALGAAGRAKPRPIQHGAGHLQFEIFSPSGERTLGGSVEDPLHRRLEYEDPQQPGAIRTTLVDQETGVLSLRIPGEANAARVIFFRETAAGREPAGEMILR